MSTLVRSICFAFTLATGMVCPAQERPLEGVRFPIMWYGSNEAPVKILAFMSASCVDCIRAFRYGIENLKRDYIDSGNVQLTILPFAFSDKDLNFLILLACSRQGFSRTFEWHMKNGYPNDSNWTLRNANNAGLNIPMKLADCPQEKILRITLTQIRESAERKWRISEVPYFIIGGVGFGPDWRRIQARVDQELSAIGAKK